MAKKNDDQKLLSENQELKVRLVRALADYDNLQKRTQSEKDQLITRANLNLIRELLPLLDLINKAQENLQDPALELVKKEFEGIFSKAGLEKIDQKGVNFDPNIHEVVDIVPGKDSGQVAEVISPGYRVEDLVLRPASVKVTKNDKN